MRGKITIFALLALAGGLFIALDRPSGPILAPAVGTATAAESAAASPTVIELFTSQGCSSCPPADELLQEVAGHEDIVALSFHVTYWDYIGWKDPFATDWSTERQSGYRGKFGRDYAYTPQMVIDGRYDVIGSRRGRVKDTIAKSRKEAPQRISVGLARDAASGEFVVTLPDRSLNSALEVWLVGYSGSKVTVVGRGENARRTLRNTHIARSLELVGRWDGTGGEVRVTLPADDDIVGIAVLLQEPGQGPIRGAAKLDLMS